MRDKELEIFFSLHFLYIVAIPRWKTLHPPREIKCESTNKRVYRRDNKKKKKMAKNGDGRKSVFPITQKNSRILWGTVQSMEACLWLRPTKK